MRSNIYEIVSELAQQIKAAYPVFAMVYPYAITDLSKGIILSADGNKYIAFSDVEGNYFYIRVGEDISVVKNKQTSFSDCDNGVVEIYNCVLVAMMREGFDPLQVKDALMSEIAIAGHQPRKQSVDPANIIRSELKGLNKKAQDLALSRFDSYITVKIEFEAQRYFSPSKCKIDLCTSS